MKNIYCSAGTDITPSRYWRWEYSDCLIMNEAVIFSPAIRFTLSAKRKGMCSGCMLMVLSTVLPALFITALLVFRLHAYGLIDSASRTFYYRPVDSLEWKTYDIGQMPTRRREREMKKQE